MGCGRVGELLARLMADDGHEIAVIDINPHALDRLGDEFRGRKVQGIGFDRQILVQAGIEEAEAAATSCRIMPISSCPYSPQRFRIRVLPVSMIPPGGNPSRLGLMPSHHLGRREPEVDSSDFDSS
jgi:hypothetical protein